MDSAFECYKNHKFCDVTLTSSTGNKKVLAHRVILYSASDWFREIFNSSLGSERIRTSQIQMPISNGDILESVVAFCYQQTITITGEDNAFELFKASCDLRISQLEEQCMQYFRKVMGMSNVLNIWIRAKEYSLHALDAMATAFIFCNIKGVVISNDYMQLNSSQLEIILKSNNLNFDREEDVFNALIRWIRYDLDNRKGCFPMLFQHIQRQHVGKSFLLGDVHNACIEFGCDNWEEMPIYLQLRQRSQIPKYLYAISHNAAGRHCLYKYHVNSNVWEDVTVVSSFDLHGAAYVSINEQILIIGGWYLDLDDDQKKFDLSVRSINVKTGELMNLKALKSIRVRASAARLNNDIFICGGTDDASHTLNSVEKYNLENDDWVKLTPMLQPREKFACTTTANRILVLGGSAEGKVLESVEYYVSSQNKWFFAAPMLQPRENFEVAVLNEFVYILGGTNNFKCWVTTIDRYSIQNDSWTKMQFSLSTPMTKIIAATIQDWIYCLGHNSDNHFNQFVKINLSTNRIQVLMDMKGDRHYCLFPAS